MLGKGTLWRARLWRRKWLLAALAVVLLVRMNLPWVLRRVLVSQASQILKADVSLGDVDLAMYKCGFVLRDLAIRLPPARKTHAAAAPDSTAAANTTPPVLTWKRLEVSLRWLPLFRKTIQLREIVLDSPHILLERFQSGEFNFEALARAVLEPTGATPPPTAVPSPTPGASQGGSGWLVGVDRVAVMGGTLHFRDDTLKEKQQIEVGIPDVEVRDISLSPDVYGKPSESRLRVVLGEGSIDVGARAALSGPNVDVYTDVKVHELPLHYARLYIPGVGWSALKGALDADLMYRLQTGKTNDLRGRVSLRDLSIHVPDLPADALALKQLSVSIDPIDLRNRVATVTEVSLDHVWVVAQPSDPRLTPLLPTVQGGSQEDAHVSKEGQGSPATPWSWSVKAVHITDSGVHVLGKEQALDVHLNGEAGDLAPGAETRAPVDLTIGVGDGSVQIKGDARVDPPGFAGELVVSDLSLPELISISGVVPENPLQSAKLDTHLTIEADMAQPEAPRLAPGALRVGGDLAVKEVNATLADLNDLRVTMGSLDLTGTEAEVGGLLPAPTREGPGTGAGDVRLKTRLVLAEPRLALGDGQDFLVRMKSLELGLSDVSAPGMLASPPPPAAKPIHVGISDLEVEQPRILVTRTSEGMVLPEPRAADTTPGAPPTPAETPPASSAGASGLSVMLDKLDLKNGRVRFKDRTLTPPLTTELDDIEAQVREVRFPDLALKHVQLALTTPEQGEIAVSGALTHDSGTVDLEAHEVTLGPYNPYVRNFSPYEITSGALSLSTKATRSQAKYDVNNAITLHDLDLERHGKGTGFIEDLVGIPLSSLLALLRDPQGNIKLDVPIQFGQAGTSVDLAAVTTNALKAALIGAVTSPLKLVGAVLGGGGKAGAFVPRPIAFQLGRAELAKTGAETVEGLAKLMKRRPGIAAELEAEVTRGDARWLREQALLQKWDEEGFFAGLLALTQRGTRARVRGALKARTEGGKGELSPDDAQALEEWLQEIPAPTPQRLERLAAQRLTAVVDRLRAEQIDEARVVREEPGSELEEAETPVVKITLRPLKKIQGAKNPSSVGG